MPAQSKRTAPRAPKPAAPRLPLLTVGKVEAAGGLLERLIDQNTDLFISKGQAYRDKHRDGTGRPLTVFEHGQLAAAMSMSLVEVREQLDDSGLRHHDEPARNEVLMAAGAATAPAFIEAVRKFTALLEMPADVFERADRDDMLDEAVNEAAVRLKALGVKEGRDRASAAMDHFAREVADTTGKGLARIVQLMVQSLMQAMNHLEPSEPSSLTDSAASTAGSPDRTSSTSSDTPAPSS